jgi:hypothetical protein
MGVPLNFFGDFRLCWRPKASTKKYKTFHPHRADLVLRLEMEAVMMGVRRRDGVV